jgi:hypothetical protein
MKKGPLTKPLYLLAPPQGLEPWTYGYNRSNTSLFLVPLSEGSIHQRLYSGVFAAIEIERDLKDWVYVSSGIEYIQHGTHFDQVQQDRVNKFTNLMHYLRVPLTGTISLDIPGISIFIEAGPYIAFTPTISQFTFVDSYNTIKENRDPSEVGILNWDVGGVIGFGLFREFNEKYKASLTYTWNIGGKDIDTDPARKTFTESNSLALSILRNL